MIYGKFTIKILNKNKSIKEQFTMSKKEEKENPSSKNKYLFG